MDIDYGSYEKECVIFSISASILCEPCVYECSSLQFIHSAFNAWTKLRNPDLQEL